MAEEVVIDKSVDKEDIYKQLIPQIEEILVADEPLLSSLSNLTAVLNEAFDKISWIGFYILKTDKLYLGPFQGKLACTVISSGKGVCGTAADKKETIIVKNVDDFPGHIACDSGSKSEIVVPIVIEDKIWGVLDLDSYDYSCFDEIDKKYLEQICKRLSNKLNLADFTIN
jgi:L-methionine (R)-S-oxide reductase